MSANLVSSGIVSEDTAGNLSAEANYRKLKYIYVFDAAVLDTEEVLKTTNAPYVGMLYPYNETLRASHVSIEAEKNNRTIWYFDVEFTPDALVIEEGYGYDFESTPIVKEVAVKGAYWYFNPSKHGEDVEDKEEVEYKETPDYPIQMSSGNPPNEPLMGVEINTQYTWWQIESAAMTEVIQSGDIYQFIGTVNTKAVTICGQAFEPFELELKGIEPKVFYYRAPKETTSEKRYKVTYTVEKHLHTTHARVLDQDFQALLPLPEKEESLLPGAPGYVAPTAAETEAKTAKRNIHLADLPENQKPKLDPDTGQPMLDGEGKPITEPKVVLNSADDAEVQDPVKLDGLGKLLAADAEVIYLKFQHKPGIDFATSLDFAPTQKMN